MRTTKKILSMILAFVLVLGLLPATAFATGTEDVVYLSISFDSGYIDDKNGNPIASVKLADGVIRAPFDFRGELYLTYYRSPAKIKGDDPNELIDVSEECAPMLPLLTASFMWLDDDAAKAQYYMSLYRDMVANVKRFQTSKIDVEYRVNGWA